MSDIESMRTARMLEARRNGKHWVYDFDICEGVSSLVQMLNDIVHSDYQLTCVIPSGDGFVVVFRRLLDG